jgi:hypothetical protein
MTQYLPGKLTFYGSILKSIAYVALVIKSAQKNHLFSNPSAYRTKMSLEKLVTIQNKITRSSGKN